MHGVGLFTFPWDKGEYYQGKPLFYQPAIWRHGFEKWHVRWLLIFASEVIVLEGFWVDKSLA